jgi:RNA-dependent RNA polymerase
VDGDLYNIIWDKRLIPKSNTEPMDYISKESEKNYNIQKEDIIKFLTDISKYDILGKISNYHLSFSDLNELKANSEISLELSQLCSDSVDFPKTGVVVRIPAYIKKKLLYPHYLNENSPKTRSSKTVKKTN